jgi:hypothetical protein
MKFGALIALVLVSAMAADDDVIVGVLESQSGSSFVARVAFRKRAGEWQAFKSDFKDYDELKTATREFPEQVDWTIASSGKARGHVLGSTPERWQSYSKIGTQTAAADLPHIGERTEEFRLWDSDGPVYRPLILVSRPNVRDPEEWKSTRLADSYVKQAIPALREAIKAEDNGLGFMDSAVKVGRAYGSKQGRVLFALSVRGARAGGDVPGPAQSLHWFAAGGGNPARFLGSELIYLDAGDFDNDRHSEVVFMKSSYNNDGYVLFFDDFRHSAEFSWSYH